jgi:hypothetical protein
MNQTRATTRIAMLCAVVGVGKQRHALADPVVAAKSIALPGGKGGIGFDDLMYSPSLHRVLVPAGRTGNLDLIDPDTLRVKSISGFSAAASFAGGHGQGTTSADSNRDVLFASDRGRIELIAVEAGTGKVLHKVKVAATPDYVRWVAANQEVWVTEPGKKQIEVFGWSNNRFKRVLVIAIPGGPESLIIDAKRKRAYTHTWNGQTIAIDVDTYKPAATWQNGCKGSRGIALDQVNGFLFVGCEEGKATVLDVVHDGKQLGDIATGTGVDIISYNPSLLHLYVPSGDDGKLDIISVDGQGALTLTSSVPMATDASCVIADVPRADAQTVRLFASAVRVMKTHLIGAIDVQLAHANCDGAIVFCVL